MDEQEKMIPEEPAQMTPVENSEKKTVEVVDIRFRNNVKTYFFDPAGLTLSGGDHVVIDTSRGREFGVCAGGNHLVDAAQIVPPLRKVLRIAGDMDERINYENQEREKKAFEICLKKIAEHGLEMQLVSCECAFDGSKLLFFFTADGRVDFRELVKDLASVFRTRIELRQIGVRDKAKMVGGLGVCGRPFCCKEFLDDFQPVSIKMAKTQSLSLNPTKISGTCGRLMCCLKYEQEAYEDLIQSAPKVESFVDTPDGRGTVTEINLLRQSVKVRMEDQPETIGCYRNCDICVLRSGKAKKNDPPIPKELAPISSRPRTQTRRFMDTEEAMPEVVYSDEVVVIDEMPVYDGEEPERQTPPQPVEKEQPTHRSRRRGGHHVALKEAGGRGEQAENAAPKQKKRETKPAKAAGEETEKKADKPTKKENAPQQGENPHRRTHRRGGRNRKKPDSPKAPE